MIRQIYFLLLVFVFFSSCKQPNETGHTEESHSTRETEPTIIPAKQALSNQRHGDPTFIMTEDTVSAKGPHSITRNILHDRNGNIWFATWQGIICFDGKLFTNMTLKEGLDHFHVFSILEDRSGNLWFGTIGGGIYRYDGKAFTHFTNTDGLAGNTVFCMLEDKAGMIWLGTGSGLSCYDGRTFASFKRKDGLLHDSVYAIVQDNSGKLWFGSEGGINSVYAHAASGGLGRLTKEKDFSFRHVVALMKDKAGNIWMGNQAGLFRYDPSTKAISTISTAFTSNLFEDQSGSIWVSGDVNRYDGKSLIHYTLKEGQNSNNLFCIFEDRSGNLWFGSMDGVRRYDGKPQPDGSGSFTEFRDDITK
jgi:ligand-binding sensor domain-containing protein